MDDSVAVDPVAASGSLRMISFRIVSRECISQCRYITLPYLRLFVNFEPLGGNNSSFFSFAEAPAELIHSEKRYRHHSSGLEAVTSGFMRTGATSQEFFMYRIPSCLSPPYLLLPPPETPQQHIAPIPTSRSRFEPTSQRPCHYPGHEKFLKP